MQDERYKNSKWFVGAAIIFFLLGVYETKNAQPEDFSAIGLFLFSLGVLICWPIDYWIHKKTVKDFKNKQVKIDPNFRRNRIIVALGIVAFLAFALFH